MTYLLFYDSVLFTCIEDDKENRRKLALVFVHMNIEMKKGEINVLFEIPL